MSEDLKAGKEQITARIQEITALGFASVNDIINKYVVLSEDGLGGADYQLTDLENFIRELVESQVMSNYIALTFGHELGSFNDKYRLSRLLIAIQDKLPARSDKETIFHEVVYDNTATSVQSIGQGLEMEYRLAAFNRGYSRAMDNIQTTINSIKDLVDGSEEIDAPEILLEHYLNLSKEEQAKVIALTGSIPGIKA